MEAGSHLATLVGYFELDPGRLGRSLHDLHLDPALGALADAALGPDAIDGLVCVGDMSSDPEHVFFSEALQDGVGLANRVRRCAEPAAVSAGLAPRAVFERVRDDVGLVRFTPSGHPGPAVATPTTDR